MEEHLEMLLKRTNVLMDALLITKSMDSNTEDLCSDTRSTLKKTEVLIERRRKQIEKKKDLFKKIEELSKKCDSLSGRAEEYNSVFPEQSNESQEINNSLEQRNGDQTDLEVSPCPSAWVNGALATPGPIPGPCSTAVKKLIMPHINPLHSNEFNGVSGYMRGRLTIETINSFVALLNSVLEQKYSIVRLKRKDVKRKDVLKYCSWKELEEEHGLTGKVFITGEDIVTLGNTKLDKTADKIIQVLRHLHRLRQLQVSGKKVVYILI